MPARFKLKMDTKKLLSAKDKAESRYLNKAGAMVRTIAIRSVSVRKSKDGKKKKVKPRAPGDPARSPKGILKNSILFDVNLDMGEVVIGPTFSAMHALAELHEFGGFRKGTSFPARPYMNPALMKTIPKLPELWANSIK